MMFFWYTRLHREEHVKFLLMTLEQSFEGLPLNYIDLDASKPWLCYWCLHALDLLDIPITEDVKDRVIHLAQLCQAQDGGFGGGPFQLPHLAATYAMVNSLILCGERAYTVINR
jgi:protein farnesyltransferase subunit beta